MDDEREGLRPVEHRPVVIDAGILMRIVSALEATAKAGGVTETKLGQIEADVSEVKGNVRDIKERTLDGNGKPSLQHRVMALESKETTWGKVLPALIGGAAGLGASILTLIGVIIKMKAGG